MLKPQLIFSCVCLALLPVTSAASKRTDARAEQAAAELLRERMKTQRPEDLAILEAADGKDIVVVRGDMDHIEDVLRAAKIPHSLVEPTALASVDLVADQIVMVNCPGEMPAASVRRLERFVRAGGLLYTTDWALLNVVQRAFPGTVTHNGGSTGDHVTAVQVHGGQEHTHDNIMSNMLLRNDSKPQWWLEGGSYPIEIVNPKRVRVLASSPQMGAQYGAAPVVVRFGWGDGQVIHVVSHFYRQAATRGPSIATKDALDEVEGLTGSQRARLQKSANGDVRLSEVESSYAFQQMTSNIVVGKQRDNEQLDAKYQWKNRSEVRVGNRSVPAGSRLKLLAREAERVKVRDDRGNEAWISDDAVEAR